MNATTLWMRFVSRLETFSTRDRVIIFTLLLALLGMIFQNYFLEAQLNEQSTLRARLQLDQIRIVQLQTQVKEKIALRAVDPDTQDRITLNRLAQQNMQMRSSLEIIEKQLIPPAKMPAFLGKILQSSNKIHVISVQSLPEMRIGENPVVAEGRAVKKIVDAPELTTTLKDLTHQGNTVATGRVIAETYGNDGPSGVAVYKHAIEVTVEGSYLDLLDYVTTLENLPGQLFWEKATLSVRDYPRTTLSLTIFSMSLDKKWMSL